MITIRLPSNISIDILDFLVKNVLKKELIGNQSSFDLLFDFSQIKYIDPEGALSLICFCSFLKNYTVFPNTMNVHLHFSSPQDSIYNYLTILGFYSQLSDKADIIEIQDIVHYESELKKKREENRKTYRQSPEGKPISIILPIETIPKQIDSISGKDFENRVGKFVNRTIDSFSELFKSTHYNFSGEDQHNFLLSNVELYKNIFEHSQSWGIATIHARPNFGTTVCYFDLGIGFKESVGKFSSELQSIEWALVDGNSSKLGDDNDGYGLTIVQEFVLIRNGSLKIRSGDCLLEKSNKEKNSRIVTTFPGVQISYFIPI